MTTIRPHTRINPDENWTPPEWLDCPEVFVICVVVASPRDDAQSSDPGPAVTPQNETAPWAGLAERVLQSWSALLRLALLVAAVLIGIAVAVMALGVIGKMLMVGLGYGAYRRGRGLTGLI